MRINSKLTIDLDGEKAPSYAVYAPVYFIDERWRIKLNRPWHHVRYHSSHPTKPGGSVYQTLHLLVVEQEDNVDYFPPHEGHSSEDGWPKTFAFCLEHSASRWFPQARDEVREVRTAKRNITKRRRATSWTRRDFLTDEPLGVYFYTVGDEEYFVAELESVDFRPVEVRETKMELHYRRWETLKANRAAAAASGA